ncbi:hypothetical protein ACFWX1_06920, partial [Amycolatopsis sp. NPDC059021]
MTVRVLLVEDEPAIAEALTDILHAHRHTVTHVAGGGAAPRRAPRAVRLLLGLLLPPQQRGQGL